MGDTFSFLHFCLKKYGLQVNTRVANESDPVICCAAELFTVNENAYLPTVIVDK